MKKLTYLVIICLLMLNVVSVQAQQNQYKVIILHTNDSHGHMQNDAKLAYMADSLRAEADTVLIVSAGDLFSGNPYVDMYTEKGYPIIDIMNRVGYSYATLGNHEFDYGEQTLAKRIADAKFTELNANIDFSKSVITGVKPYALAQLGQDVSIAFLGLIQLEENGIPATAPKNITNCSFRLGVEVAPSYSFLRDSAKAVVALSHLGADTDSVLAEKCPWVDVVIGGHTHTLIEQPCLYNEVLIAQTGSYMEYVGKVELTFANGKLTQKTADVISFETVSGKDVEIDQLAATYLTNPLLDSVIAICPVELHGKAEIGSMYIDALQKGLKLDVAVLNNGAVRKKKIAKGNITVGDVYALDPFKNTVWVYEMTVEEIKSLLKYSYEMSGEIDMQVAGMTYTVLLTDSNTVADVELKRLNGKPFSPKKTYSVGVSSYVAKVYKFDHHDAGVNTMRTTTELLFEYIPATQLEQYKGMQRAFTRKK